MYASYQDNLENPPTLLSARATLLKNTSKYNKNSRGILQCDSPSNHKGQPHKQPSTSAESPGNVKFAGPFPFKMQGSRNDMRAILLKTILGIRNGLNSSLPMSKKTNNSRRSQEYDAETNQWFSTVNLR